ncbi:hypothetical protein AC1031_004585 [Aphanomyces cochlioides]|nr:hypothetical protein AC1031_004585 [Aphanomyces cochlioides]
MKATALSAIALVLAAGSFVVDADTTKFGLPRHTLVGYWHNFANPSGDAFPLHQVNASTWDVVNVAFAESLGDGRLSFTVDPTAGTQDQFIADVKLLQATGKKVVLSLGGEKGSITLQDTRETINFVESLASLIQKFGFDGIDLDLENGVRLDAPIVQNLIDGVKKLKQRVGPSFYLSMAPEHPYVQGGFGQWGGLWGSYLAIIDGLRDELTQLHVQYYNNNGLTYPDGRYLHEGTIDGLVGGSLMLLEGFTAQWGQGFNFKPLRADQVAIGLPSGKASAGQGYASQDVVTRALTCLTHGVGCDTIRPKRAYSDFRGLMSWSINWDRVDNFAFSTHARGVLDSLDSESFPTFVPTTTTTPVVIATDKPSPVAAIAKPIPVAASAACNGCTNCYYAPTNACYKGWNVQQCLSVAGLTWCGD